MQIAIEVGALLSIFTRMSGAHRAVEIGTFTGYSSICIARMLAPGGRLLCCESSSEYSAIAKDAWIAAGLTECIDLRIAPALETLRALSHSEAFDFAFIDADKFEYELYYEQLIPRLRSGGILLVDNTLWWGRVADGTAKDELTVAMRDFNDHVAADTRVDSCILPVSDGLTLICKR